MSALQAPRAPAWLSRVRGAEQEAVRGAAERLLRSRSSRLCLAKLAADGCRRVVALGDSLTADPLSWAEILSQAFREVAPELRLELVNLGAGGDTTVHLVSRFADVVACNPNLLVVMAGTNDARRHGRAGERMLVQDCETKRNLALICRLAREETAARPWLVTPPPVLSERIRRAPALTRERVSWRGADVARKAALVRGIDEQVIDSHIPIAPPLTRLLRADGLHLTLMGQERLARWMLRCLIKSGAPGRG